MTRYQLPPQSKLSIVAVLAFVAALASFVLSCSGRGYLGLGAACVGMAAGLLGFIRASSPGIRGAMLSLVAIALSVFALVPAIAAIAGRLVRHL